MAMATYGLQRGIAGSEAKHRTTTQYYRDLKEQQGSLQENIEQLQQQESKARKELKQVSNEINTNKLKGVAVNTATNLIESVNSLFVSSKTKILEVENKELRNTISTRDSTIKQLQIRAQHIQEQNRLEMQQVQAEHQKEVSRLNRIINKACAWFPLIEELFRMETFCKTIGFSPEQTKILISGKSIEHTGKLYSEEHKTSFMTNKVTVQIVKEPTNNTKLVLIINGIILIEWFKQLLRDRSKQDITKSKGIKR